MAAVFGMGAHGGGFVSRRGLAALRSRGGGSQGLILSPVRRVPRPLPLRSARLQAPVAPSSVFSGAAGYRLRHGILPLLAAASCRRGAGRRPGVMFSRADGKAAAAATFRRESFRFARIRADATRPVAGAAFRLVVEAL